MSNKIKLRANNPFDDFVMSLDVYEPLKAFSHGEGEIIITPSDGSGLNMFRPTQIHHISDADNQPAFIIVMSKPAYHDVACEISLRSLAKALSEIGYVIERKTHE